MYFNRHRAENLFRSDVLFLTEFTKTKERKTAVFTNDKQKSHRIYKKRKNRRDEPLKKESIPDKICLAKAGKPPAATVTHSIKK
mgnify:CR=1 FL=1